MQHQLAFSQMNMLFLKVLIFCLSLIQSVFCLTHRHCGLPDNGSNLLNGRRGSVRFSVELKKDVLLWEQMSQDGLRIQNCTKLSSKEILISIRGASLDISDYVTDSVFVIQDNEWPELCKFPESEFKLDAHDPMLFFAILAVNVSNATKDNVLLSLISTSGRLAVPSVNVFLPSAEVVQKSKTDPIIFGSLQDTISSKTVGLIDDTKSMDELTFLVQPGVQAETYSLFEATVDNFRFRRLSTLQVEWEQSFHANASTRLTASIHYEGIDKERLYYKDVAGLSYMLKIPFVGTLRVRGYKYLDFVQSIITDENVTAYMLTTTENIFKVSAALETGDLSIESLLPTDLYNTGDAILDFQGLENYRFGLSGFIGYTFGLSIDISLGQKSYSAGLELSSGLQTSMEAAVSPFHPTNQTSVSNQVCNTCHQIRTHTSVVGKDLKSSTFKNGVFQREKTHIETLFEISIPQICLFPVDCAP